MADNRITFETLKLLVRIAWADREVSIEEMNYILGVAGQSGVSEQEREALRRGLVDASQLPQADMELLKGHREDVLRSIDLLIGMDERIVDDERAARDEIARLLR